MEKKSREFEWFLGRIAPYFNVEVDEKKVANESYILCRDERDADGEYFLESEIELLPEEILFYVMSYVDDTESDWLGCIGNEIDTGKIVVETICRDRECLWEILYV